MKYSVRHSPTNPRHRETISDLTRDEAIDEMERWTSDERGPVSDMFDRDGKCIATRDWAGAKITWLQPQANL